MRRSQAEFLKVQDADDPSVGVSQRLLDTPRT
jgi:hypothetical protein